MYISNFIYLFFLGGGSNFFISFFYFLIGETKKKKGREGGRTKERSGTDNLTAGPVRGLEKKTKPDGANRHPD